MLVVLIPFIIMTGLESVFWLDYKCVRGEEMSFTKIVL